MKYKITLTERRKSKHKRIFKTQSKICTLHPAHASTEVKPQLRNDGILGVKRLTSGDATETMVIQLVV